ncbi:hypothetical protein HanXRQr2_Chr15g0686481 [Helianthus annuus]|uniref:Uncharacterized protein n=1 Tax=Helianthus annuus TaxID=4232 RepID=A0A9K3H2R8_HELAN|nr:hypothetical protein HanXRQr2_Chr15g0686481 [Helianthus annuus]KAJ0830711.1 hypothetical protein HanPSC8_Chr15g0658521 [Helianthus annuus]
MAAGGAAPPVVGLPLAKPGCVWTRTFTASMGQRATSAITSADAEPAR